MKRSSTKLNAIVAGFGLITVVACAPQPTPDTPELRLEKARALAALQVGEGGGSYEETLDRGAALALEATTDALTIELGRELSDQEALEVEAVMRGAIAEALTPERWAAAATDVYAAHFSAADLQAALDFYSSPVGIRILGLQATVDQQMADAVEDIVVADLEVVTAAIDAGIGELFPELAEGAGP